MDWPPSGRRFDSGWPESTEAIAPGRDDRWVGSVGGRRRSGEAGGVATKIINGGLECGHGPDGRMFDRISFYKRLFKILNVTDDDNIDCLDQEPFDDDYYDVEGRSDM